MTGVADAFPCLEHREGRFAYKDAFRLKQV